MTCQDLVELVTEYHEGNLPRADVARFDAHLAQCGYCAEYLEQMRQTIRVAVNDRSRGPDGEWVEETMWIRVEVWDQAAERLAEQLRKGNKIFAEGQLRAREYQASDGQTRTSLELRFARVQNLERRPRDEAGGLSEEREAIAIDSPPAVRPRGAEKRPAAAGAEMDVDDIPF